MPLPSRLLQSNPSARLVASGNRLERLDHRCRQALGTALATRQQALERAVSRLDSVNPLAVLARGYAMVTEPRTRAVVRSVEQVGVDAKVDVRVADGRLRCVVTDKHSDD